jgi:hypothetical protein
MPMMAYKDNEIKCQITQLDIDSQEFGDIAV